MSHVTLFIYNKQGIVGTVTSVHISHYDLKFVQKLKTMARACKLGNAGDFHTWRYKKAQTKTEQIICAGYNTGYTFAVSYYRLLLCC